MRRSDAKQPEMLLGLVILGLLLSDLAGAQSAPKLRYGFQGGHKYAYQLKIVATVQDCEITHEGILSFEVTSATESQFVMKCSGNLAERYKGDTGGARMWPMHFGPPRIPGPFGPGFVQHPEGWTLNRHGGLVVIGRIDQLPFLLGPRELLIIEPFPDEAKSTWEIVSGVGVVEKSSQRIGPFGPPWGTQETGYGGSERCEYTVAATTPETIYVKKKYSLTTEKPDTGGKQFKMTGEGEFDFDVKQGVFKANQSKFEIQVKETNLTLTVPVTLTYRLLTQEEAAEHEKKERQAAEAAAEAAKPKPVSASERASLLADLRSGDDRRMREALRRLGHSVVGENPDEVSGVLAACLASSNEHTQVDAANALKVWATANAEASLIQASRSDNLWLRGAALRALGRIKSPTAAEAVAAQFPKDIPAVQEALRAIGPAAEGATIPWLKDREERIREEACNLLKEFGGRASIAALEEAASQARGFEHDRIRNAIGAIRIRVPSQGPDSSAIGASNAAAASGMRSWQDASRTYTIEASLVSSNATSVTLKKKDGRTVTVPLEKLSTEDQAWVKSHAKPVPPNPFE